MLERRPSEKDGEVFYNGGDDAFLAGCAGSDDGDEALGRTGLPTGFRVRVYFEVCLGNLRWDGFEGDCKTHLERLPSPPCPSLSQSRSGSYYRSTGRPTTATLPESQKQRMGRFFTEP